MTVHSDTKYEKSRRDFIYLATGAMAAVGTSAAMWPFIDSMNPSASVLSAAAVEVDLSPMEIGQRITVMWRGKPVFVDRRAYETVSEMDAVDLTQLRDPETDNARTIKREWLVVVGVCTHLGCVPLGQDNGDNRGEWGGWFCPCHGSHYDRAGRIMKGPAPKNLVVPPYRFKTDDIIIIG